MLKGFIRSKSLLPEDDVYVVYLSIKGQLVKLGVDIHSFISVYQDNIEKYGSDMANDIDILVNNLYKNGLIGDREMGKRSIINVRFDKLQKKRYVDDLGSDLSNLSEGVNFYALNPP